MVLISTPRIHPFLKIASGLLSGVPSIVIFVRDRNKITSASLGLREAEDKKKELENQIQGLQKQAQDQLRDSKGKIKQLEAKSEQERAALIKQIDERENILSEKEKQYKARNAQLERDMDHFHKVVIPQEREALQASKSKEVSLAELRLEREKQRLEKQLEELEGQLQVAIELENVLREEYENLKQQLLDDLQLRENEISNKEKLLALEIEEQQKTLSLMQSKAIERIEGLEQVRHLNDKDAIAKTEAKIAQMWEEVNEEIERVRADDEAQRQQEWEQHEEQMEAATQTIMTTTTKKQRQQFEERVQMELVPWQEKVQKLERMIQKLTEELSFSKDQYLKTRKPVYPSDFGDRVGVLAWNLIKFYDEQELPIDFKKAYETPEAPGVVYVQFTPCEWHDKGILDENKFGKRFPALMMQLGLEDLPEMLITPNGYVLKCKLRQTVNFGGGVHPETRPALEEPSFPYNDSLSADNAARLSQQRFEDDMTAFRPPDIYFDLGSSVTAVEVTTAHWYAMHRFKAIGKPNITSLHHLSHYLYGTSPDKKVVDANMQVAFDRLRKILAPLNIDLV